MQVLLARAISVGLGLYLGRLALILWVHRDNHTVEILDEPFWKIGTDLAQLGLKDVDRLALLM